MLWESPNNSMEWFTLKGPKISERTSWVPNSESVQCFCCGENKTKQNQTKSWRRSCSPSELLKVILTGVYKGCPCCSLPNWGRKRKHRLMKTSLLLDKISENHIDPVWRSCKSTQSLPVPRYYATMQGLQLF